MADEHEYDVPEGFEPFSKHTRSFHSRELAVRLQVGKTSKQFLLSKSAYKVLDEAEYVRYYLNEETNQVAIAPADQDDPNSYSVNSRHIAAGSLLSEMGLGHIEGDWYFKTTQDEDRGWLLLDLSDLYEEENDA